MVVESELHRFVGAILSPVNYGPQETNEQCSRFREKINNFDIIFDPQLYVPRTDRGQLQNWRHMPADLDSTDLSSLAWWNNVIDGIVSAVADFRPNAICSPAPFPRAFDDEYYDMLVSIGNNLAAKLNGTRPLLTALVGLDDLGRNDRYLRVASILSKYSGDECYLVLCDNVPPRYERTDTGNLEGACRLMRLLVNAGKRLLVGCTSTEMILWKAAGVQNVASGKFFNLRRFTLGRWDDDASTGGRNISYWFEPTLLAFLREADVRRFMKELPICPSHRSNPYSQRILDKLKEAEYTPWLADSWRQFLYWFAQCEADLGSDTRTAQSLLERATATWHNITEQKLRFEEERNTGEWVRAWDIVMGELARRPD